MIQNGFLPISFIVSFYLLNRERERESSIIYIDICYKSERESLKNTGDTF
nr:MAG TPA: hypothetical protein [Bacteriophage sp.]